MSVKKGAATNVDKVTNATLPPFAIKLIKVPTKPEFKANIVTIFNNNATTAKPLTLLEPYTHASKVSLTDNLFETASTIIASAIVGYNEV